MFVHARTTSKLEHVLLLRSGDSRFLEVPWYRYGFACNLLANVGLAFKKFDHAVNLSDLTNLLLKFKIKIPCLDKFASHLIPIPLTTTPNTCTIL